MAGVARSGLAALDAATGALDAAFDPAPSAGGVEAMVLTASGRLLLGGGFTKIGATARNHLAAVTAATGALDAAWAPSADGAVHTLRLPADGPGPTWPPSTPPPGRSCPASWPTATRRCGRSNRPPTAPASTWAACSRR